ncbi:MAG: hypothetical protein QME64_12205 [bacterium]|nr:hypothetical protein [bacterium]
MSKSFHYNVSSEEINNVEISKTAKGNITFTVKAYGSSLEVAKKRAVQKFRELQQEFKVEAAEIDQGSEPLP